MPILEFEAIKSNGKKALKNISGRILNQGETDEIRAIDIIKNLIIGDGTSKPQTGVEFEEGKYASHVKVVNNNDNNVATHSGNTTETVTVSGKAITISNDGNASLTISVNDVVSIILAGETVDKTVLSYSEGFDEVIITTTVAYRMWIYS